MNRAPAREGCLLLLGFRRNFFMKIINQLVELGVETVDQISLVVDVRRNPPELLDDVVPGGVLDLVDRLPLVSQHGLEDGREIPQHHPELAFDSCFDGTVGRSGCSS